MKMRKNHLLPKLLRGIHSHVGEGEEVKGDNLFSYSNRDMGNRTIIRWAMSSCLPRRREEESAGRDC